MKIKLILATLFILTPLANAQGSNTGNGGYGKYVEEGSVKTLYTLDLIQGGNYLNPWIDENACNDHARGSEIRSRVAKALENLTNLSEHKINIPKAAPVELIAQKMCEISKVEWLYGEMLLRALEMYHWAFVPSLVQTYDNDKPVVDNPEDLIPIALRQDRHITILFSNWNLLANEANRVALIFHEIQYGMTPPELVSNPENNALDYKRQSSSRARQITAYLFNRNFQAASDNRLRDLAAGYAPIIPDGYTSSKPETAPKFYVTHSSTNDSPVTEWRYSLVFYPTDSSRERWEGQNPLFFPGNLLHGKDGPYFNEKDKEKIKKFCTETWKRKNAPFKIAIFLQYNYAYLSFHSYIGKRYLKEDYLNWSNGKYVSESSPGYEAVPAQKEDLSIENLKTCPAKLEKALLEIKILNKLESTH